MRSRGGILAALLLAVAAIAGAAVWAASASDDSSDQGSRPVSAAGRPATTTTVTAPEGPPPLETTGEDWDRIVRSLVARLDWAYRHPDPALIDDYATPKCPCYQPLKNTLAGLAAKGEYSLGGDLVESTKLSTVLHSEGGRPVQVLVYVVSAYAETTRLDRDGHILERAPAKPPVGYHVELVRGTGDRWRVNSTTCLGTPGVGQGKGC